MGYEYIPTEWGPLDEVFSPEEVFYNDLLQYDSPSLIDSQSPVEFTPLSESGIISKYDFNLDLDSKSKDDVVIPKSVSNKEKMFMNHYIEAVGELDEWYPFFSALAKRESGYDYTIRNKAGAPAWGYFQFMQDGVRWNNISKYAGVDIDTFLKDPVLQIRAARSLASDFLGQLKWDDYNAAASMGYDKQALLGGM
jgi:hypothetical protein